MRRIVLSGSIFSDQKASYQGSEDSPQEALVWQDGRAVLICDLKSGDGVVVRMYADDEDVPCIVNMVDKKADAALLDVIEEPMALDIVRARARPGPFRFGRSRAQEAQGGELA